MFYIEIAFFVVLVVALIVGNTRGARLKRLAHAWNACYDKHILTLLTPGTDQQLCLFKSKTHRFSHVLTWSESRAFVRVCDDKICSLPSDKQNSMLVTLASAELTRGSFVPFILTPRKGDKTPPHPALPESLAMRYTLQAPANFKLSPAFIALLQARDVCYVEASIHALVYHEYKLIDPLQIAQVRWYIRRLVAEMAIVPATIPPSQTFFPSNPDAQVQALMNLHVPSSQSTNGINARWGYGIFWLVCVGASLWVVHYLLHHLPGR